MTPAKFARMKTWRPCPRCKHLFLVTRIWTACSPCRLKKTSTFRKKR